MGESEKETAKKPVLKRQPVMETVLKALAPILIFAVYAYGLRTLLVFIAANLACFATEYYFTKKRGDRVTGAVFVTGSLLALSLPPNVPLWICALGGFVAITFGKELFGGFGKNLFNPALVGRAFIFVSFPATLSGSWFEPVGGAAGGFAAYKSVEAVSAATPLPHLAGGGNIPFLDLLLGNTSGSLGEGCALLIILGGIYMAWKKVASKEIILSTVATYFLLGLLCWFMGWGAPLNPVQALFAGGFLYGAIFMATDPVSAVASKEGKIFYGFIIGLSVVLIRNFGNFPEGTMFAILLGNTFGPIAETGIKNIKAARAEGGGQ